MTAYQKRKAKDEQKVLEHIQKFGGFSLFSAYSIGVLRAIRRLENRKKIAPKKGKYFGEYPWCGYKIL